MKFVMSDYSFPVMKTTAKAIRLWTKETTKAVILLASLKILAIVVCKTSNDAEIR
jgi:hypothetical protein